VNREAELKWPTGVGCGDLLGCVFLVVMLIISLACGVYVLVVIYKMNREEYQYRREYDQYHRERGHNFGKRDDAPAGNLGKLGSQDKNLSLMTGYFRRDGIHNPGICRKVGNRLAMLLNLFLCLFRRHKIIDAPTRPNAPHQPRRAGDVE
jgi:hypothetical protein